MRFQSIIASMAIVLIATGFSSAFFSQSQGGTILGTVTDETKALIPGVTVSAFDAQGERRSTVISDPNGNYSLANLPAGTYTVTAVLPGFETATTQGVALAAQVQFRLDFTLRIARQRTAFIPLPPAGPRDRDVSIRADNTTARGTVVLYKGNVEMKTDSVIVRADELDFDSTTQQADARGNVRIQVLPINARVLPLAEHSR